MNAIIISFTDKKTFTLTTPENLSNDWTDASTTTWKMFGQLLKVSLSMSKHGYTSSIFGKVNGTFYHIVLLLQRLLPHICLILSDFFIFWQSMLDTILHVTLPNVHQVAKFFHCRPHCQFVIKKWLKISTTPQMCHYKTLWFTVHHSYLFQILTNFLTLIFHRVD